MDTRCECEVCGRTCHVLFVHCIHHGWPRCCKRRMTVKEANVDMEKTVIQSLSSLIIRRDQGSSPEAPK